MAFVNRLTEIFDAMKDNKLVFFSQRFPIITRLPITGYLSRGRYVIMVETLKNNIKEDVERCLKNYNPEEDPECFVQAYYQKMQTNPHLNYDNLLNVCMDFFMAGMETTTTTLRWGTLFLASNVDVQEKVRAEIFRVLGADGKPSYSLRTQMPYTSAAIQEIQRRANIIPLNVLHKTIRDTSVGSVKVPGNTFVIGHIQHVMAHSPVYKEGKEFRPERFLMDDGVTANKEAVEQLCPFSVGKRQCAGEGLAKVELFVGLVTLLQNYKVLPQTSDTYEKSGFL
ncbi:unspecific monooxygenase [Oesophagostomum dentatum]|uniref:Unspecific monooxygenase n=1 Tax=Oesophagostomum dentatum TaxID=61180 RepID=A0A0B1SPR3_OESDE|nr:unspecific monooxygenase [Oesophagostomum dentatum]